MSRDRDHRRDEDFASRWSRMKRGATEGSGTAAAEPEVRDAPPAEDARGDEEILRELGLPDPETLKPGDDIKGFMASAVPARIRNRVLRRLWISNPALANLDGLVDYGEDFTDAAMVPAMLQTAYKVGRGWARDAVEDEPEAASSGQETKVGADETAADAGAEAGLDETGPEMAQEEDMTTGASRTDERLPRAEAVSVAAASGGDAREGAPPSDHAAGDATRRRAARRMRFRFAGD